MNRRSIRLRGYDYASPGWYFVTVCTHKKEWCLSQINDRHVELSNSGMVVDYCWKNIPKHFSAAKIDAFVIMPNHVHGIINLVDHGTSLSSVVQNFKSVSARRIRAIRPNHKEQIWQRNYYEHIIRNDKALSLIRLYIELNPLMWSENTKLAEVKGLDDETISEILSKYTPGA